MKDISHVELNAFELIQICLGGKVLAEIPILDSLVLLQGALMLTCRQRYRGVSFWSHRSDSFLRTLELLQ